jgi:hypothetical protein
MDIAVEQFIAHELFHCGQNLLTLRDVQAVRNLGSPELVASFDLSADIASAKLVARLDTARCQNPVDDVYAQKLQMQLRIMCEFAVKAFGAPLTKLHKLMRFIGLLLVSARILDFQFGNSGSTRDSLPLDTPLMPYFEIGSGRVMIVAQTSEPFLWRKPVRVNPATLLALCEELETAPFALSLQRTKILLNEIDAISMAA